MKNSNDKLNEQNKNKIFINSIESKQNKVIENNNNLIIMNYNALLNILTNEDIYLNLENINILLKEHHKSIMKSIGKMIQIILNNSDIDKNEFIGLQNEEINIIDDTFYTKNECEQYINILHQMELNQKNFNSTMKKIILKINKYYNKRKKRLKKYNSMAQNNFSIYCPLLKNKNLNEIVTSNKYTNNPSPVIINNIQNIINTFGNKSIGLFDENSNKYSLAKIENEEIEVKFNNEKLIKNQKFKFLEIENEFFMLKSNKNKLKNNFSFIINKVISNLKIVNTKNLEEKRSRNNIYKELLIQKNAEILELKNMNKPLKDKISFLEKNNIKLSSENNQIRSELISMKKYKYSLEYKIKQNEKTISLLNKKNENISKENKEVRMKYNNEIKNLNISLNKSNLENKKLYNNINALEEKNKKINQSFNYLNISYKQLNNIGQNFFDLETIYKELEQEKDKNKISIENYQKENNSFFKLNNNIDIIKENEKLKKELKEFDKKIEFLNKKLEEQNLKTKYYKSLLSKAEEKIKSYDINIKDINIKLEEAQKQKYSTKTLKISNDINDNKIDDNIDELDPKKFILIKYLEIEGVIWCLFKKQKENQINQKYHYYSRYHRLRTLNNIEKSKEKNDEYIWKQILKPSDINKFGDLPKEKINENENKMINLEQIIKDLKEKLNKKEEDFNRININYAKLLKKARNPETDKDKLIEEINSLKKENKMLNIAINKLNEEKNILGISFIEDDLDGSFFIDNFCFDKILEEIDKSENKFMAMNNTIQKKAHSNNDKNIEDIKLENTTNNFL